ncbi:Mpo1-like protein [Maricaulis sp.]|uniref:Mpo1-like protein n=1 Tax=Maricaulis sp. TaxID=1486257 RepID=UPI003A90B2FA
MREHATFQSFWPFYLQEHAKLWTRTWHFVGSTLAIAVLIYALVTQTWWLLAAVPVSGYFFAWVSHAFVERNKPATFTYPLWSLVADYRMYGCFLTGRLDAELDKAGVPTGRQADEV